MFYVDIKMLQNIINRSELKSSNWVSSLVAAKYCYSKFAALLFALSVVVIVESGIKHYNPNPIFNNTSELLIYSNIISDL
jgi:hypothetical protein